MFGVDYDDGPQVFKEYITANAGIGINTHFKEKPGMRGNVSVHRCDLRQGTVEYDVEYTRDTIALALPRPQAALYRARALYTRSCRGILLLHPPLRPAQLPLRGRRWTASIPSRAGRTAALRRRSLRPQH